MLSGRAFEQELQSRYAPLLKRLTKVENQINRLIIRTMSNAKISTVYWNKVKRELNLLYVKMNNIFSSWASK